MQAGMYYSAMRDEASLNIIVPMGGSGEAFRVAGYTAPKPMIKIAGRPLLLHLLDSLHLRLGDVVWLIIPNATYLQFQSQLDLKTEYPTVDIRVCTFSCLTHGAIETIFIGLQHMTPAELNRRTLCLDCDTLYFSDVLSLYRSLPSGKGMCAYFIDRGTAALYSYLRLGEDGHVAKVCEKEAISDLANIGAYGFASGALLRTFIQTVLDAPQGLATEFFLSHIINLMISDGHAFVAQRAEECAQCGTPEKLEQFMYQVSTGKALTQRPKRRFCFALDNVLVTPPATAGDMSTVRPIEKNVQLVRELKASGHYIIITTSRLMQECGGNVGAVVAACGNVTLRTLEILQIPYDEIHFGQPFAHVYVDASVACSALDTEKDLGWRVTGHRDTLEPGMVAARHFNNVQLEGDYVVKTAAQSVLRGEIFFYEHMPSDIKHLFPTLTRSFQAPASTRSPSGLEANSGGAFTPATLAAAADGAAAASAAVSAADEDPTAAAASAAASAALASGGGSSAGADRRLSAGASLSLGEGVASMTLSRIKGVTFSHLVTNRSLTPGRLVLLLKALRELHSSAGDPGSLRHASQIDLGANYLPKLRKRYAAHKALYARLSPDAPRMFERLEAELSTYAAEERWQHAPVIHGDPVFSNVLLTEDGRIYLLDMRGEIGSTLTLQGDLLYDLSKVYQSLLGYDYIILSHALLERDAELLEELQRTFRAFVSEHYPSVGCTYPSLPSDSPQRHAERALPCVTMSSGAPLGCGQDHRVALLRDRASARQPGPPGGLPAEGGRAHLLTPTLGRRCELIAARARGLERRHERRAAHVERRSRGRRTSSEHTACVLRRVSALRSRMKLVG